jgi:hypothetical protein
MAKVYQPSTEQSACLVCAQVVRVMGSLLPAGHSPAGSTAAAEAGGRSLQIVASFDAGSTALGVAPFGADLAVLTWGACSSGGGGGGAGSSANSSSVAGGGGAMGEAAAPGSSSSTAEEQPSQSQAGSDSAAAAQAAVQSLQQAQSVQQPHQQRQQQQQQLSLCFYCRSGQLLAADALEARCAAAQRHWHQLALLYPGDADLQLTAASASAVQQQAATPRGSSSSAAGSALDSGRSSPEKAGAVQAGAADGGAVEQQAGSSGQHAEQQHAQQVQQVQQQYKWWRDGEEPMYLVSSPAVSLSVAGIVGCFCALCWLCCVACR